MKTHYLQHVPFEGLGIIETWAIKNNHSVCRTQLFDKSLKFPDVSEFDFLIIMGGPMNIYEEEKFPWLIKEKAFIKEAISKNKKVLGLQFHLETTPQSAEKLIRHCGDEIIINAQFIQTPKEILTNSPAFEKSNKLMDSVLELISL